jgi:cytochrome c oxidase subunit 2
VLDAQAAKGKQVAIDKGCVSCHSPDGGVSEGPTWKGLYGHEVTLQDGTTVTADEAYLLEAIHQPGAKLVEGFPNVMPPNIADQMKEDQIADIIEYIKSLK